MCARYSITTPTEGLRQLFLFEEMPNLAPRYNVAPTQEVPAVRREDDGKRHLRMLRWGLIPFWAKDRKVGHKMINARAESVAEKPAFRAAFKARRCLIPTDGFYEWTSGPKGKQPHRIVLADRGPFALAGLWERWRDKEEGETVESCTVIVTAANDLLQPIHDRMPVILSPEDHETWLDPEADRDSLKALLRSYPSAAMATYEVSQIVNKPANDEPACIEPLAEEGPEQPTLL